MRAMRRYAKEVCKAQNWKALPGFIVGHSSSMDQGDIRFSSVIPEVADVHRLGRYRKSLLPRYDFTGFMPYLFSALMVLFFFGLALSIASWCGAAGSGAFKVLNLVYAGLGALIFSFYIILDTQLIVGGKHNKHRFSIDDYCMAAINIYVDIIQLFLFLLELFGNRR
ncbi:unnamed protein product [Effrenium voratum]|nr:unnamed protein product [Effrenium voratum]